MLLLLNGINVLPIIEVGFMGEKIRVLGHMYIGDEALDIELNKPPAAGLDYAIHIQNDKFRFDLAMRDFLKMAGAVLESEKQFLWVKGKNDE